MARLIRLCALLMTAYPLPATGQSGASPELALGIGLAATLIPTTAGIVMWTGDDPDRSSEGLLIASGVVVGPAIGYWSAGMSGRGWKTLGLRTGLFLLSFIPAFGICGWNCTVGDPEYDLAWAVIATGAGLGAASAVYDLARMKRNVREHRVRQTAPSVGITPTYIPRTHALGMRVSMVF
jgi:hypothetical protein